MRCSVKVDELSVHADANAIELFVLTLDFSRVTENIRAPLQSEILSPKPDLTKDYAVGVSQVKSTKNLPLPPGARYATACLRNDANF
ncbi:hypothetical protein TNCV_3449621 [Trichonephila clavipes]|nr:hypothetical protein TNCV_3449621 [Trichonephila clavipes]